jgi:hypothetical protein
MPTHHHNNNNHHPPDDIPGASTTHPTMYRPPLHPSPPPPTPNHVTHRHNASPARPPTLTYPTTTPPRCQMRHPHPPDDVPGASTTHPETTPGVSTTHPGVPTTHTTMYRARHDAGGEGEGNRLVGTSLNSSIYIVLCYISYTRRRPAVPVPQYPTRQAHAASIAIQRGYIPPGRSGNARAHDRPILVATDLRPIFRS